MRLSLLRVAKSRANNNLQYVLGACFVGFLLWNALLSRKPAAAVPRDYSTLKVGNAPLTSEKSNDDQHGTSTHSHSDAPPSTTGINLNHVRNFWDDVTEKTTLENIENRVNSQTFDPIIMDELRASFQSAKAVLDPNRMHIVAKEATMHFAERTAQVNNNNARTCPESGILFLTQISKAEIGSIYCAQLETAARFDIPMNILSFGNPNAAQVNKMKEMINLIRERVSDDCIILFNDADVYFQKDAAYFKQAYLNSLAKVGYRHVLVSAECACWPNLIWMEDGHHWCYTSYPKAHTKLRYVNSGGYIGYAKEVLELFDQIIYNLTYVNYIRKDRSKRGYGDNPPWGRYNFYEDDQELLQSAYYYGNRLIKLDHDATIFLPLGDWNNWGGAKESMPDCPNAIKELTLDPVTNLFYLQKRLIDVTKDEKETFIPPILHFNGPAKYREDSRWARLFQQTPDSEASKMKKRLFSIVRVAGKHSVHLSYGEMCKEVWRYGQ